MKKVINNKDQVVDQKKNRIEDLMKTIEDLKADLSATREDLLRATAEIENVKKRSEKDIQTIKKFALSDFTVNLLPFIDSIEEGIRNSDENLSNSLKILRDQILNILKDFNINSIYPVRGDKFDCQKHEVISLQPADDTQEDNTIFSVIRRGYAIGLRTVRAAKVILFKKETKNE